MTVRRPRAERGFTLLETVCALAVMAIVLGSLTVVSNNSISKGGRASDLRSLRVMADTVFRRIVYEHWKWDDGMSGTADEWYADFAEIPAGPPRERWKVYRLELTKTQKLVAGTDPDGGLENLMDSDPYDSTTVTPQPKTTSGTGTETPAEEQTAEPVYVVELRIYALEDTEPTFTLRSIVPVPESERAKSP
jgi:prepilin-type N-terminal cleavage/methylation domain-containing protein